MTYGRVAADLRDTVGHLITVRRPRVGLGGANGTQPATTSPELMRSYVELIQRYRATVLDYTIAALETAIPPMVGPDYQPAARLARWLRAARPDLATPEGRHPGGLELGSSFGLPLVEAWRRAAVAAVAGTDRELPAIRYRIDPPQRWLLIKDASEVAHALLRLDDRYARIPGWQLISTAHQATHARHHWDAGERARLVGGYPTALHCERLAASKIGPDSFLVEHLGHREHREPNHTPRPTDAGGVGDAVRALGLALDALRREFPAMPVMRALLRHHRLLSAAAVRLAVAANEPDLVGRLTARAEKYAALLAAADNVSGNLGGGRAAVDDTARASETLRAGPGAAVDDLRGLARAFDATDTSLAMLLRHGIAERLYLVTNGNAISGHRVHGIRPAVAVYEPITASSHPVFVELVRGLAPVSGHPVPSDDSIAGRRAFATLLATGFGRPGDHDPGRELANFGARASLRTATTEPVGGLTVDVGPATEQDEGIAM